MHTSSMNIIANLLRGAALHKSNDKWDAPSKLCMESLHSSVPYHVSNHLRSEGKPVGFAFMGETAVQGLLHLISNTSKCTVQ